MPINTAQSTELKNRTLVLIILSSILLYFIFAPATNILYYGGDDFRYSLGGFDKTCASSDGFYFPITLGRPIQAYLDCLSYKFADNLERMRILRFISVCLMGCGMGLLTELLFSMGFPIITAFFFAGGLFLTQKLYGDTVLTGATSLPIAIIFALLSYRSLCFAQSQIKRIKKIGWITLACSLLFCALLTYPAMTFFFPSLILIKLLFSNFNNWSKTQRQIFQETFLFCSVCGVYFLLALLNMHFNALAPIPDAYRLDHPNLNAFEIIHRAIPLLNLFDTTWILVPISLSWFESIIIIILMVGGIYWGLRLFSEKIAASPQKRKAWLTLSKATAWVVFLMFLSSAFFLVMPSRDSTASRLLFATVTSNFVLCFWCITKWCELFPFKLREKAIYSLIGVLFVFEAYEANIITTRNALSFSEFLTSTKQVFAEYQGKGNQFRRIHFIIPEPIYPYNKFFLTSAALVQLFGKRDFELQWCSLARGVPGDEKDHQAEAIACVNKLPKNGIAVTYSRPGEPYQKTTPMMVIDKEIEPANGLMV